MHEWSSEVLTLLSDTVGEAARAAVEDAWHAHARRELVEVTLLGPYSSGKTSVLRRLLAEEGTPFPEWLTVSGRRETFEMNEIDALGLTFTDAPGFGTTVERHEGLAEDALALSDAFLLVVPPNLLTTGLEFAADVVSGKHFFAQPVSTAPRAVLAVVNQSDELGIDPADDVGGMLALAARKQEELKAQLEDAAGALLDGLQTLAVAADPYQEQAYSTSGDAGAFAAHAEWDGIGQLREALQKLRDRREELREDAELRYFSRIGRAIHHQAAQGASEELAAAEEIRSQWRTYDEVRRQLEIVIESARIELMRRLSLLGSQLAEEAGAEAAPTDLAERLNPTIEAWSKEWSSKAEQIVRAAEADAADRLARPSAASAEAFIRRLASRDKREEGDEELQPNSRIVRTLNDVAEQIRAAQRTALEKGLDRSLNDLLAGLDSWRSPGKGAQSAGSLTGKAANVLPKVQAGLQIADGVLKIATTFDAELRQRGLDTELLARREKAQDELDAATRKYVELVIDGSGEGEGWKAVVMQTAEGVRDRLGLPADPAAVSEIWERAQQQMRRVQQFGHLLEACPSLEQTPDASKT